MSHAHPPSELDDPLKRLVGYLNFSLGARRAAEIDASIMLAWNEVYEVASQGDPLSGMPAWLVVQEWVNSTIQKLRLEDTAFSDAAQVTRVSRILWSKLLPAYLDFHSDLLFHQEPELIFNGFFMGRAADAILSIASGTGQGGTDDDVVRATIDLLDDYVGYRPVAMLENRQTQPYRHEFVCPIPLFVKGVGSSAGPYRELISGAIECLKSADPSILRAASFDLDRMHELCMDPRAYDFDHPVNKRPNYHFGGWDERAIDGDNYFYRFIVREITMSALLTHMADRSALDEHELQVSEEELRRERLLESSIVLAGTVLMASGISGYGPGAYSSDVTLAGLMQPIAAYRDDFYIDQLNRIQGEHGERLRKQAQVRHQPFGAVRQFLNAALATRRAAQLQHVQLARLYARMGYPEAAGKQLDTVPAASSRMMSRIDCAMTVGLRRLRSGALGEAAQVPSDCFAILRRGIECGAIIDPWDILGFSGNYPLYPGPESSVHDQRVEDVLYLIEQLFAYIARVWSEAAAQDDVKVYDSMEAMHREIADWWRQYAAHTIESLEAGDPLESYESAKLVARALRLWHRAGAGAGNVAFWAPHADLFDSPRAYALVVSALLERDDFAPSMALLVHWLGNAERIGLRSGVSSLPRLAERWLLRLRNSAGTEASSFDDDSIDPPTLGDTRDVWPTARRFFDYLEANAEQYWSAPSFVLGQGSVKPREASDWEAELMAADESHGDEDGLFDAAYEGMTYQDTTDDGFEGAVFDGGGGDQSSETELEIESRRLSNHLDFLQSLARTWAVGADLASADKNPDDLGDRRETLIQWARRARENRIGLLELLDAVRQHVIGPGGSDKDSMRSYDRRRVLRDSLMEKIINAAVEMSDARRLISGVLMSLPKPDAVETETQIGSAELDELLAETAEDDVGAIGMTSLIVSDDRAALQEQFSVFIEGIRQRNLLYIPLARGGDPVKIYIARLRQRTLRHLMHWLPRRGLIAETCQLIETARMMEQTNPIGIGAVTEFDGLYRDGFRSLVAALVEAVKQAGDRDDVDTRDDDLSKTLIDLLEQLTETMLGSWLSHSQTLRLSPLETVNNEKRWKALVDFVKRYGDPIFTQMFLQLGNIRAILHQGVGSWLRRAVEEGEDVIAGTALAEDLLEEKLQHDSASEFISLVYETLLDHHAEYMDYNSTTTQSDRGNLVWIFLDFLRLKVRYERIAWNLKPVMWAHEVLVRCGLDRAAVMWRRSLAERIDSEADVYQEQLRKLQRLHAIRMPTVADRISERFIQPMTVDRMRSLVAPAMRDVEKGLSESASFELLQQEAALLCRSPSGVGLEVPDWLETLQEEVARLTRRRTSSEMDPQSLLTIAIKPLPLMTIRSELARARNMGRKLPKMKRGKR
ncbi:MAG: hypothetical protein AAF664_11800 [Planctomycetota bacterium]